MNSYHNFGEEYAPLDIPAQQMTQQQSMSDLAWLDTLQQHLTAYLVDRVKMQEVEIFRFCLRNIFLCVDRLHQLDLSDPTTAHNASMLTVYRLDWQQLVSLTEAIERLEALCRLLQGALLSLLDGLDVLPQTPVATADNNGTDDLSAPHEFSPVAHAQWNTAYTALADRFEYWQLCSIRQISFSDRFAPFITVIPVLPQVDAALSALLEDAIAIFGDILLDFQAVSTGDEEAAATLLLDIAQKADQILANSDTLLEALPILAQHHAPGQGMS